MMSQYAATARWLTACLLVLVLPMSARAWEPNAKDRNAALESGDLSAYTAQLSTWLQGQLPADPALIKKSQVKALLKDPVFMHVLAERQFIGKVWDQPDLPTYAKKDSQNAEFVKWLMSSAEVMDDVMLTRTPSVMFARADNSWSINAIVLDNWKRIYYAHPESRKALYLKLAIATVLRPPGSGNAGAGGSKEPIDPLDRFAHYLKAHQNGELMPSFDTLSAWEMTHVVSSAASNEDLEWGRATVNTFGPGFRENEKVGTLTSQMRYQGSQIPYNNMSCLLAGGGKCGPRSSFGVFINQAFGIPSIGVGQPAHAAVSNRDRDGNWHVTYGRGWNVSKVMDRYNMSGGEFLERVKERSSGAFADLEHCRWLTASLSDPAMVAAVMRVADVLATERREHLDRTAFDRKADTVTSLRSFASSVNAGERYTARVRGFLYPSTSGDYVFRVSADDFADLFLSSDEDPENKVRIAHQREWSEPTHFTKFPTQSSAPIRLDAGKKYYIEAVHRENAAGDHLVVVWSGPGVDERVIPGAQLSSYPSGKKGKIVHEVWNDAAAPALASAALKPRPEAPIKVAKGVIHVEAEDFIAQGGMGGYGYPGVPVTECYEGGKQITFGAMMQAAWVGYKIHVPKSGVYELTSSASVINWGQRLYVRSFGAMYPVASAKASDVFREQREGLGPQLAADNHMGTRWAMNFGKEQGWLELDLGHPRKISKAMIEERGLNQVSRFQVDYKAGEEWVKLFDGDTLENFKTEFPPVTAQFVRLSTFDTRSSTGGPSIWEFSVGDAFDGSAWIDTEWKGSDFLGWQITKPVEITLTEGDQTIWLCAPSQRGLALRWFELTPRS